MDKEEIVKYVMNTPGNTNEQILRLALDDLEGVNPNSTKVITGTIGSPFGDITLDEFKELEKKLEQNDMSISIDSDLGRAWVRGFFDDVDPCILGDGAHLGNDNKWSAFELAYIGPHSVMGYIMIDGEQLPNLDSIKNVPCTTTFVYHPLPTT